jgi:ATP/maltotriose-dependent transcriptional regulator MalT/DNA-binding SARP family transcriptional activator
MQSDHRHVIRGKLVAPPLPDRYTPRPRLERAIARLMDRRRAIVVSATAGSGKTTAVAGAARRSRRSVAWLTLDRPDRAPGRLLTYLEAAIERRRPAVRGLATGALAAGIPHAEVAGLLAEASGGEGDALVLVLDELERLGEEPAAWGVIEALVRYAPTGTCLVLISRRAIPTELCALPSAAATAVLTDADLAFTVEEAGLALARSGKEQVDVGAAVGATAGWVTGVLFEGWRSADHFAGPGGETDPLYDYLSSQILGQLEPGEREFLIETSVLDEVTVPRAQALGQAGAGPLLAALRRTHLPATWEAGGRVMRCHSYFREYLLAELARRGEEEVARLRLAHGRRLAVEGHDEEAADELLRAGAPDEALASVERAIVSVVERLDLAVAERWLAELAPLAPGLRSVLVTAELLLAIARDDIRRGVEVVDRLGERGERERLAASSDRAGLLMVWCYLHAGRVGDVDAVLEAVGPGPGADAMRYAREALFGTGDRGRPVAPDPPPPGPIGAIVCNADFALGRLGELEHPSGSGWVQAIELPWRIAALRARGRTEQALELFEHARERAVATTTMLIFAGPEVLMDAGRWDEARELIGRAREVADASGSFAYRGFCGLLEAKLELRSRANPAGARAALELDVCRRAAQAFRFIGEVAATWHGFASLLEGDHERALAELQPAVDGMLAGDRYLELPTAAVFLSEAAWRAGEEQRADDAADLALTAARRHGSNHTLLQALADFPAVVSRRLDAEPGSDSEWHEIGRALLAQGVHISAMVRTPIDLFEFGRRELTVAGREVRPRIAKSYELLAFLATRPGAGAGREELLQALFGERRDESARAYLRQAVHRLREALGDSVLQADDGRVTIASEFGVMSESVSLERRLAEAARLQGEDRLRATLEAVAIYDRGEYLPGARAEWADERQQRLAELVTEARYHAAVLALGAGRHGQARQLVDDVLRADPLREAAWRLAMRVAQALGDDDGVLRAYQGCEGALAELGTVPSASTRQLLERLRR